MEIAINIFLKEVIKINGKPFEINEKL